VAGADASARRSTSGTLSTGRSALDCLSAPDRRYRLQQLRRCHRCVLSDHGLHPVGVMVVAGDDGTDLAGEPDPYRVRADVGMLGAENAKCVLIGDQPLTSSPGCWPGPRRRLCEEARQGSGPRRGPRRSRHRRPDLHHGCAPSTSSAVDTGESLYQAHIILECGGRARVSAGGWYNSRSGAICSSSSRSGWQSAMPGRQQRPGPATTCSEWPDRPTTTRP
jgi:hypothetical protein